MDGEKINIWYKKYDTGVCDLQNIINKDFNKDFDKDFNRMLLACDALECGVLDVDVDV